MRRDSAWGTYFAVVLFAIAALLAVESWQMLERTVREPGYGQGYVPDLAATREFLGELEHPTFADAGADALASYKGVDTFLYRHVDKAHRAVYGQPWKCWNQGSAGTCVSFAFGLGCYTGQAVDWTQGELPAPPRECATEPIYGGSRTAGRVPPIKVNNGGDGSYGAAAARWVSGNCKVPDVGGILYRQPYPGADLSTYSIPLSREWGRNGVPLPLAKEAHRTRAVAVAQVSTWEELCAAIERGSPVVLCSTVGYGGRSVRDADGFLPRGSSWSHAMLCWAVRYKKNGSPRDGGLIQNSWSERWLDGPTWPADQPDGSFWARREDIEAALKQGDSFAVGGIDFSWRELDHGGWLEPAPVEALTGKWWPLSLAF